MSVFAEARRRVKLRTYSPVVKDNTLRVYRSLLFRASSAYVHLLYKRTDVGRYKFMYTDELAGIAINTRSTRTFRRLTRPPVRG